MDFNGKPNPVMNCNFQATANPPLPKNCTREQMDEWGKMFAASPECLCSINIAFPRYYWRAKYLQKGQPVFIVDHPALIGENVIQLKDCTFIDLARLKLPNGVIIDGLPFDDMPTDLIRRHTAILEQDTLSARAPLITGDDLSGVTGIANATVRKAVELLDEYQQAAEGKDEQWQRLMRALDRIQGAMPEIKKDAGAWGAIIFVVMERVLSSNRAFFKRIESRLDEGVKRIECAALDATLPPGKRKWWENLWAAFKKYPDSMGAGEKWEAVARMVLAGVWENAQTSSWKSDYMGQTTFRKLAGSYRKKKAESSLMRDKLWTMLDRQWTAEQEKAWARNLRRYAERERDKAGKKMAIPKTPA